MKVSCICPTYNRVISGKHLLEETLECFLRQDYENKELLILNDHPRQRIHFDHPQVRIFNFSERFPTLGGKYNYGIQNALGDYICTWEDDDISLPHRISKSIEHIKDAEYFNPKSYYFSCGDTFKYDGAGYSHNCSMYSKKAWERVGGYPEVSGPQDAQMDGLLRTQCSTIDGGIDMYTSFYIYRWGVSELHLSGYGNTQQVYDEYALKATSSGDFVLYPSWQKDYVKQVSDYIEQAKDNIK